MPLQQYLKIGVYQWCTLQKVCCDVIYCCRERIGGKCPHSSLQCLRNFSGQQKHHWLLGRRVTGLKQEGQSPMICLSQAVLSHLLVLKCCSVLMTSFAMIDTSLPTNWCSVFQSAKGVEITHLISQIFENMCDVGSVESYSWIQHWEKIHIFWVCNKCSSWGRGRLFPGC